MNNTLLLLFGGRPQPNAILTAMLKPQQVVALVSQDSRYDVQEVLAGVVGGEIKVEKVPPYHILHVRRSIERHLEEGVTAIGVTGAPLPMAVAAYEAARQRNLPVYYVNTGQGEILDLVKLDQKPVQIKIPLSAFFSVYRLALAPENPPAFLTSPEQRIKAAHFLGRMIPHSAALLAWLRKEKKKKQKGKPQDPLQLRKRWPENFSQVHWSILRHLQDLQLIQVTLARHQTQPAPQSLITIHFPAEGERKFLFGEWLEVHVAEKARATGLLDDVQQGLRFQVEDGYREVDFLALFRGIPLLGSCKATRKAWYKGYLDEINAVAALMGGRYTWRFFFTDQTIPMLQDKNAYRSYQEFMAHAHRLRIRVITAKDLPRWGEILQQELRSPTYPLI